MSAVRCSTGCRSAIPTTSSCWQQMVSRGQIELFGAGDAEPVLAAIPQRDRLAQLEALSARLALRFGKVPHGAWLTERVWESSVVPALAQSGIGYATVDDYHFLCTGSDARELDRYFTTEEDGETLDIFPISEALRYRIPFAPADDAVRYIESLAQRGRRAAAIYFDDIEKFGVWPQTYAWVFEQRWLRDFVERVLASPRIESMHFADFHRNTRSGGIVYLPSTSYVEMNQWTLPPPAATAYAEIIEREKRSERYAATKGFVRGGIWRNFLTRYPEANWMHKRMLGLSQRLAQTEGASDDVELRTLLHRAQANDAYWHGLFGGLYLPHLRRGIYASLLALESKLDAIDARAADRARRPRSRRRRRAVRAQRRHPDRRAVGRHGGDSRARLVRASPQLRRHAAPPSRALSRARWRRRDARASRRRHCVGARADRDSPSDEPPRTSSRTTRRATSRATAGSPTAKFARSTATRRRASTTLRLRSSPRQTAHGSANASRSTRARMVIRYDIDTDRAAALRTTLDLAMPSCDGFAGRYIVGDDIPCGFGQPLDLASAQQLTLDDRCIGGAIELHFSPAARIVARPYRTVSQSEDGFERIMQSATVEATWAISPTTTTIEMRIVVRPDESMAANDGFVAALARPRRRLHPRFRNARSLPPRRCALWFHGSPTHRAPRQRYRFARPRRSRAARRACRCARTRRCQARRTARARTTRSAADTRARSRSRRQPARRRRGTCRRDSRARSRSGCRRLSRSTSRALRASSAKLVTLKISLDTRQSSASIFAAAIASRRIEPEPSSRTRARASSTSWPPSRYMPSTIPRSTPSGIDGCA